MVTDEVVEIALRAYYGLCSDGTTDDTEAIRALARNPVNTERMRAAIEAYEAGAWQPTEEMPTDTAMLTYGFGYDVAHFNAHPGINALVACWDHRPINGATHCRPLPAPPLTSSTAEPSTDRTAESV